MESKEIAANIESRHWGVALGWPIPQNVEPIQPVRVGETQLRKMSNGNVERVTSIHREVPDELNDPEWWWLTGLWWGDGTSSSGGGNAHAVSIAVADTQPEIGERIRKILSRWNYGWHERQSIGCSRFTFSCKWFFLWSIAFLDISP